MIYPMRRFGYNVTEEFLSWLTNFTALVLLLLGILRGIWPGWFGHADTLNGVLCCGTIICGIILGLGSAGIRQNRPVLNLGFRLLALVAIVWIVLAIVNGSWASAICGMAMLLTFALCKAIYREAVKRRFNPRYLSLHQFETLVQIADAMIDDGRLHPIEIAIRTDHLLACFDSPIKKDIRTVLFLLEWITPLLLFRPFPFSDLGTHERRAVVQKVIWSRGLFRDVARTLKVLTTFSFYTHPDVRRSIGYTEVDDGERRTEINKTPLIYPFPEGTMSPQNSKEGQA